MLREHDPLSERVHLGALEVAGVAVLGVAQGAVRRFSKPKSIGQEANSNEPRRRCRRHRLRLFVLCRHAHPAAPAAPGHVRHLRLLPRGRRHRRRRRRPRRAGRTARAMAARHRRALCRASRRRGLRAWRKPCAAFGLKREDFLAIIDGMEMDVRADIRAPDLATLDLYCDRVASAVGRLSVRVFGMNEAGRHRARLSSRPRAAAHQYAARHRRGRRHRPPLYAARISRCRPASRATTRRKWRPTRRSGRPAPRWRRLPPSISTRPTPSWRATPRSIVRAPRIMGEAYHAILRQLLARGWAAPRAPVKLGKRRIAQILIRSYVL